MFLFIVVDYNAQRLANTNLNTSHVLIYLTDTGVAVTTIKKFKYISCSYLSISTRLKSIKYQNLNTSHVLIYPACKSLHPHQPLI